MARSFKYFLPSTLIQSGSGGAAGSPRIIASGIAAEGAARRKIDQTRASQKLRAPRSAGAEMKPSGSRRATQTAPFFPSL